ncbi:MAG: hypothetical protein HWE25_07095 [Alphaproteobacteria bacterium]|nr:hypothetical protein [Alphaproteobacteria bacterium]
MISVLDLLLGLAAVVLPFALVRRGDAEAEAGFVDQPASGETVGGWPK